MMIRCAWRWACALVLALVQVQAVEAQFAPPAMRPVQVGEAAFTRGAPLPGWVQRQVVPPSRRADAVVWRLRDAQVRLDDQRPATFVEWAVQVNDAAALGEIGQIQLAYVPQYQRLNLHAVQLLRGGQVLDRTAAVDLRFLERETGFERGVYSGVVTVAIVVQDVRVGDTLNVAYLLEGGNPVFGPRFNDEIPWDHAAPTELRTLTVHHREGRALRWRLLSDAQRSVLQPTQSRADGWQTLRFEERGLEPLWLEPQVPDDFFEGRLLQVSDWADWNEVARWAEALFPPVVGLPDELAALVGRLRALPSDDERVVAALQWVQQEIRNFSLSIGESSHRPHAPAEVLRQRYGDCKDKVYLLLTLLRASGVPATPMLVSARLPAAPARVLPGVWPFDHVILQVPLATGVRYLDPTRPPQLSPLSAIAQPGPWTVGLLASTQAQGLTRIGDTQAARPLVLELAEHLRFDTLGAAGTLEARLVLTEERAELMRAVWRLLRPEQRRQIVQEDYLKRYPGLKPQGEPVVEDDLAHNRFALVSRYAVPDLARAHDGGWLVPWRASSLDRVVELPPAAERRYPLRLTLFPMERRYSLTVDWPAQVAGLEDPSTQVVDSPLFRAEARETFRGSRYRYTIRVATKRMDLQPDELPGLRRDLKRLGDLLPNMVVVERHMIGTATPSASAAPAGAAQSMQRRLAQRLEEASGRIRSGLLSGDALAQAHALRADRLSALGRFDEAMADLAEAQRLAPDDGAVWLARGEVMLRAGELVAAEQAYSRAIELGKAEGVGGRGMARVLLGRLTEAQPDLARAAQPDEDDEADLYARLWQMVALLRAGTPLPADVLAAARQDPAGPWPRPVLALLAGDLPLSGLMAQIDQLTGEERSLALAEAWFYIGQWHLAQGRTAEAIAAFERCRAEGIVSYYEHVSAGHELRRLKAP